MTFLQAIFLGIVQGITEFLPISSSAHLVLVPYFLGWKFPADQIFPFDVLVQLGTLASVMIYFRKDLAQIIVAVFQGLIDQRPFATPLARLGWYLVISTIPAIVIGLIIKNAVEMAFNSPTTTGAFLFVTAAFLIAAEKIGHRNRSMDSLGWKDALWIGFAQAASLFPGISRSGSTIAGGMSRHFQRADAGRFSFLMSIPVMFGAGLVSILDLGALPNVSSFLPVLAAGFVVAAIVGYLAIGWLLSFINRKPLTIFAIYCVLVGSLTLLSSYVS